jgi:hypothetical protein
MRSRQIRSTNEMYPSAVNNKLVETKEYNELQLDVVELSESMVNLGSSINNITSDIGTINTTLGTINTALEDLDPTVVNPILLDATVWDDLRAPATGINPVGSPSPATPNTDDGSLTFAKGNVCISWFQLPHSWKEGTDLSVHIHWSKSTTNGGTCNWQMKYKWFNIGAVDPGFSVLAKGTEYVPNSNTVGKHALIEWTDLSGVGKTLSSMLCVYIARINDGDDTFTGNGNLYEIDCHYQVDSLGSTQEYIK